MHSINRPGALSKTNIPTGVTSPPRDYPSLSIPRHGSLVFHPTEMLYGVGGPDGTGESGCEAFRSYHLNASFISACHWVQAPLGLRIPQRPATVILHHDIFPSPLYALIHTTLLSYLSVSATAVFPLCSFIFTLAVLFTVCCGVILGCALAPDLWKRALYVFHVYIKPPGSSRNVSDSETSASLVVQTKGL